MKKKNRQKKKSLARKFISAFCSTLLVLGILTAVAIYGYEATRPETEFSKVTAAIESNLKKPANPIKEVFAPLQERTNFVIFGVDDAGTRTDTMMVGCFNSVSEELSLVSVPRDTMVVMPKERRDILAKHDRWTPSDGVMKLNEVHHYAGENLGVEFAVKQLEELLGIELEYYVKVDLKAFEYIVDAMDGVEFDVPQSMDYEDPVQELYIHLKPGVQKLTGKQALGLVRFRSYKRGDWQRMEVQQAFLRSLLWQALAKENIINNAGAFISAAYNYVETNFRVADAPKYMKYAKLLTPENITAYSVPSSSVIVDGKDFVQLETDGTREIIRNVFYGEIKTADSE